MYVYNIGLKFEMDIFALHFFFKQINNIIRLFVKYIRKKHNIYIHICALYI